MEEDLQPRRDEVFSISSPALQCPSAFGANGADAVSSIGLDSDAEDCEGPVFGQGSLGQSDWRC
eukprot:8555233-Alexandrium_andersonii.AAC.1